MNNQRPLIVIEALDAGGSQTQTDLLVKRLKKERFSPLALHFPQEDSPTGQFIYQKFLLNHNGYGFTKREQALLYIQDFFSRAQELWQVIKSKDKKKIIVSDRYCTSTMAYQTVALSAAQRQSLLEWIDGLCYHGSPSLPKPSLVVFIDTPVAIALDRLDAKTKDFHENQRVLTRVRHSYLQLAQEQKWAIVSGVDEDGRQRTRDNIHQEIWEKVKKII